MTLTHWLRSVLAPRPASRTRTAARRLAVERLEDRLTPSTGGLPDPTFGSGGHVLSSFTNDYDAASAVAVQSDGRIVVTGSSQWLASGGKSAGGPLVARYNADGSVDTSFGSGGHVNFSQAYPAYAVALQPQTSGASRILVGGTVSTKGGGNDFSLARYNANGTLDTTFGGTGHVTTDLGGSIDSPQQVLVDGSGRILVVGYTNATGPGYVAALVRYTANGALDTTFGSGGKLVTTIGLANQHRLDSVALQADGKIVLAGTTIDPATGTPEFVLARFNTNGTADTTFGSGGSVVTHPGYTDHFGGVAIQGDGKIVVSGSEASGNSPPALYLLRYNTDGTLDPAFGTGGVAALPSPGGPADGAIDAHGVGPVIQSDGEIIAGGQFYNTTAQQEYLAVVRVHPDGSMDVGFGSGGWATIQFASNDSVEALALQPDGRVLLAGYAKPTSTGPTDVALVRFLGSAPQIGSFTASPNPVTAGSSVTLTASNISDGNAGATVTQVAFYADGNGDGVLEPGTDTLLGYATQTSPGVWTYSFSTSSWAAGSYKLFAQAEDSYGVFGDPLALSLQVV